jgi:hypothetical protein
MALLNEYILYRNMINVALKAGVTWVGLTEDQAKVQGIKVKAIILQRRLILVSRCSAPMLFLSLKKEVKP